MSNQAFGVLVELLGILQQSTICGGTFGSQSRQKNDRAGAGAALVLQGERMSRTLVCSSILVFSTVTPLSAQVAPVPAAPPLAGPTTQPAAASKVKQLSA